MTEEDILTLARTMWGEARGEDNEGMKAVCCAIINRFNSKKWFAGKTIAETCLKPWQFSCWNPTDPNRLKMLKLTYIELKRELDLIKEVTGGVYNDITSGATHYYAPKACPMPKWAKGKVPCYVHGNHLFFKDID